MKKYIAKTNVSVNVVLTNGKNMHVSFSPLTGGGSVFYTEVPEVQEALEKHYKFGRLFKIDQSYVAEKPRVKKEKKPKDAPNQEEGKAPEVLSAPESNETTIEPIAEESDESETGVNVIVVTDPDEAKDYLCEHYGLSRTKIKSLKAIKEAAAAHGITFKGLE